MDLKNKKVLVVGLARSGRAASEFLARQGARVTANDASAHAVPAAEIEALKRTGINVVAGEHPEELFLSSDVIVVSPGVPLSIESLRRARQAGVRIIGEVELASWFLKGKLVGVTGSNGKTTTTTLIGELLSEGGISTAVGGNIGTPLISLVEASRAGGITVAELSSFQLEAIERFRAHVAVLTNVTPDHLDRYDSFASYARAKERIFENQTADDLAVLNADDPVAMEMRPRIRSRVRLFSSKKQLEEGIFVRDSAIVSRKSGEENALVQKAGIKLLGEHNLQNVMAALAVGLECGVAVESLRSTISRFQGVEHRLEPVTTIHGVRFFNDSKATNVDAAEKAILSFSGRLILILGGKDKDGDFTVLAPLIRERVDHVLLIGAASDKIARQLQGVCPMTRCASMRDAVRIGFRFGRPGSTVLLAPACASFDMFDNYEHRGRIFKQEALALASEVGHLVATT